jgi:UDP-N-acetylglucosamine:LPS N-acetylglucosamine transferase
VATPDRAQARRAILELLAQRDPGKTICPSDAARVLGGDDGFQPLMGLVREAAAELVEAGRIEVTQQGEPVDLERAKGPIRLRAVHKGES